MNVPFVIQKISRDVVETILMNPSEPHRHDLCEIMLRENEREPIDYTMIRHLLGAVLSKLEYNYRRPAGVDFYADKLNMSSRNLNLISQTVFGKDLHTQ